MGNTSTNRRDKLLNKEDASRSSSSPLSTVPTNSNELSEASDFTTNGMESLSLLQNASLHSWRSSSQELHCEERESCPKTTTQQAGKQVDYLERRRKNNDSARRSREVRRQREASNRQQVEMLERENMQLRAQIALLRLEVGHLSLVLFAEGVKLLT